jgi:hypothetical protein
VQLEAGAVQFGGLFEKLMERDTHEAS